jgi:hypothetical protein
MPLYSTNVDKKDKMKRKWKTNFVSEVSSLRMNTKDTEQMSLIFSR